MSGRLVISMDFELMWGVRDHRSIADYGDAVLGVRKALPKLLTLFQRYGVRATWATVGLLFARNRQEMLDYYPIVRPAYRKKDLSPYEAICSKIGNDEADDPWHYGRSLVDQLLQADVHEIATHTYSHYYCLEVGQTIAAFDADLQAAIAIMGTAGVQPSSIVFPRNQMTDVHVQSCARHGIRVFRGNPESFAYSARAKEDINPFVRGLRLIDSSFPITSSHSYQTPTYQSGCTDVRASRFFRPYDPRLGILNSLHVRRIVNEMKVAAAAGETYHLWCHPHNFGRYTLIQLDRMETILLTFRQLQDSHGLQNFTMAELTAKVPDLTDLK